MNNIRQILRIILISKYIDEQEFNKKYRTDDRTNILTGFFLNKSPNRLNMYENRNYLYKPTVFYYIVNKNTSQ